MNKDPGLPSPEDKKVPESFANEEWQVATEVIKKATKPSVAAAALALMLNTVGCAGGIHSQSRIFAGAALNLYNNCPVPGYVTSSYSHTSYGSIVAGAGLGGAGVRVDQHSSTYATGRAAQQELHNNPPKTSKPKKNK